MLKPEQYIAISYFAQVKNGGLTYEQIAEICGVTPSTLWRWKQNEEFREELRRQIKKYALDRMPEVIDALLETAIKRKSIAAAELLMEATGMVVRFEE